MIGGSTFSGIFGPVAPGDPEYIARIAKAAAKAGYAVVVNKPGTKQPMCTLTARQAKAADRVAQERAAAGGKPRAGQRRHPCGLAGHAMTDPEQAARVVSRLVGQVGHVNLGLELGASRLVCVDVDTAAEHTAFLASWSAATGQDETGRTPTVRSPGAVNVAGEWVHKDGGHYWFTLPAGVDLPPAPGVIKASGGWAVMWNGRQILVPPSLRPEGPYELLGQAEQIPGWLLDLITREAHVRQVRARSQADQALDSEDVLERWSATAAWADILEDGWVDTGLVDNCSCPIWTAPGSHHSPKSATAHELGCEIYNTDTGWGPLHLWTDVHPPWMVASREGLKTKYTWTKLQYVAGRDHSGDVRAAMVALGLVVDVWEGDSPRFSAQDMADLGVLLAPAGATKSEVPAAVSDSDEDEEDYYVAEEDEGAEPNPVDALLAEFLSSEDLDGIPDPEPLIVGMLDMDTISRIVGKSNHGKSFVAIDMACSIATGRAWHGHEVRQGQVIYVVAEGVRGYKKRLRAWENRYNDGVKLQKDQLRILRRPIQVASAEWRTFVLALARLKPVLVVLDTQARITVGVKENDATDMGMFIERVDILRNVTSACVLPVHHLGHLGDQGRGSSAVIGAINTEIRVVKDAEDPTKIVLHNDKQKDEAHFVPLYFTLDSELDSVVLVRQDPFEGINSPARPDRVAVQHEQDMTVVKGAVEAMSPCNIGTLRAEVRRALESVGLPGMRDARLRDVVDLLIREGKILSETGGYRNREKILVFNRSQDQDSS